MVASGGSIELDGLRLPVGRDARGVDPSGIADIRSAVKTGIAVEYLAPGAGERNADPVTVARHGRHVANDQDRRPVGGIADEGKNRIGTVVADRPLKAVCLCSRVDAALAPTRRGG